MGSTDDGFQDRLRKIQEKHKAQMTFHSGPAIPVPEPEPLADVAEPRRTAGTAGPSATPFLALLGVVALIGAGSAVYLRDLAPREDGPVIASLAGIPATSQPEVEPLAIPDVSVSGDNGESPDDFVPPAPDGWMRVVRSDAEAPRAVQSIYARWKDETGADFHVLEMNTGYRPLKAFLESRGELGGGADVLAAYYAPNGHFVTLSLQFLAPENELGPADAHEAWIGTLERIETGRKTGREIVERVSLGSVAVTNTTLPPGASILHRPIADHLESPNGLKIAVPISHRAILRLEGLFRPSDALALFEATDRPAVLAALK